VTSTRCPTPSEPRAPEKSEGRSVVTAPANHPLPNQTPLMRLPATGDNTAAARARLRARRHHRAVIRRLDTLIEDLDGPPLDTPHPGAYGLTERELRAHARELYRSGWSIQEINSVLDVPVAG